MSVNFSPSLFQLLLTMNRGSTPALNLGCRMMKSIRLWFFLGFQAYLLIVFTCCLWIQSKTGTNWRVRVTTAAAWQS